MRQPGNLKPVVCRKLDRVPLPLCRICLTEIVEGESMLFWGPSVDGKKEWVHFVCWRKEAEANRQEIEQHDRATNVEAAQAGTRSGAAVACDAATGQDIRDELIIATQQAYDIEAHVGSLLASLRVLAAKVSK